MADINLTGAQTAALILSIGDKAKLKTEDKRTLVDAINSLVESNMQPTAVLFTPMNLTDDQKSVARNNINAKEYFAGSGIAISESGVISATGGSEAPVIPVATSTPRTSSTDDYTATGSDLPEVRAKDAEQGITHVGKGKQIIFVPTRKNLTDAPTLSINSGADIEIRARASHNMGNDDSKPDATVSVPAGALMRGVPYTMTFCGSYWLVDTIAGQSDLFVTPEMFGAVGDGVHDDTAALQTAMSRGEAVILRNTYLVSDAIAVSAPAVIGYDATIKVGADIGAVLTLSATRRIGGITFDCNNYGVTRCIISSTQAEIEVYGITVKDIRDMRNTSGTLGICLQNKTIADVHDIVFTNCQHLAVEGNDDKGNITCIYLVDCKYANVTNCTFSEIHNIDSGGTIAQDDSNAIFVFSSDAASNTVIENCTGKNTGKRFIKTAYSGTLTISNCVYSNDKDDILSVCGIESYTGRTDGRVTITNCDFENSYDGFAHGVHNTVSCTRVENVSICDTQIKDTYFSIYASTSLTVSNCNLLGGMRVLDIASGKRIAFYNTTIKPTDTADAPLANTPYNRVLYFSASSPSDLRIEFHNCRFDMPSVGIYEQEVKTGSVAYYNCTGDGFGAIKIGEGNGSDCELRVENCDFTKCGEGRDVAALFAYCDRLIVKNSFISSGTNVKNGVSTAKGNEIIRCVNSGATNYTKTIEITDNRFESNASKFITVPYLSDATRNVYIANISAITTAAHPYQLRSGDVVIGDGVEFMKLDLTNSSGQEVHSYVCTPRWVNLNAAPENSNPNVVLYPIGIQFLSTYDGKLYKLVDNGGKTWQAVT